MSAGSLPVRSRLPPAFTLRRHLLIWKYLETLHICTFCFCGFRTSPTLFSDFLSLVLFISPPTHPPLPTSIPLLPSLSLPVELCPSLNSLAQSQTSQYSGRLYTHIHTCAHTHTHTSQNLLKKQYAIDKITNGKNRMCI